MNVKGIGYKLHHSLIFKNRIVSQHFVHSINFGEIFVNESKNATVELLNDGDFNFDYQIQRKRNPALIITPESGTVHKHEKIIV